MHLLLPCCQSHMHVSLLNSTPSPNSALRWDDGVSRLSEQYPAPGGLQTQTEEEEAWMIVDCDKHTGVKHHDRVGVSLSGD